MVPVYNGSFRVVQPDVVLEDIRRQVAAGARAHHVRRSRFLQRPGPRDARSWKRCTREWPALTYDVTIKVEHLLQHRDLLPRLRATGCLFVTSAVESLDDAVLERLAKGHTRADFVEARAADARGGPAARRRRSSRSRRGPRARATASSCELLVELDLVDQVAPIQLAIRLLIPEGSLLLELPEVRTMIEPFDPRRRCAIRGSIPIRRWTRSAPAIQELIKREERQKADARGRFSARSGTWRRGRVAG